MEMTPYHFGNNDPNYWADPSGLRARDWQAVAGQIRQGQPLNSGNAALDAMWEQTEVGTSSYWTSTGGGNFQEMHYFSFDGTGGGSGGIATGNFVFGDGTSFFDPNYINLPEVVVENNYRRPVVDNSNSTFDLWSDSGNVFKHSGPILYYLASPAPKRFISKNSSQTTTVLSEALGKWKKPIRIGETRRLYTHTVNGTPRYAATWGRFIGRWGSRIAGPLGVVLTTYDLMSYMYENRAEIEEGMQARDNYIQDGLMPLR